MQRQPVVSSRVSSIGWEKGVMEVEFNTGAVYQYSPVEWQTALNLIRSANVGKDIQAIVSNKSLTVKKISP